MSVQNIGVVNYSDTPDAEVMRWAAASQSQMASDVAPIWSIPAPSLALVAPDTSAAGVDSWIVVVNDEPQRAGLGFHEIYNGQPVGYVLVEYTKQNGQTPSRVFSHEVLEMAIDPLMTNTVNIGSVLYLIEPGDILAFDAAGYRVGDVLVSGFATPAYFHLEGGNQYGFRENLSGPLPAKHPQGSMLSFFEDGQLKFEMLAPTPKLRAYLKAHEASRRRRRSLDRALWRDREYQTAGGPPGYRIAPATRTRTRRASPGR